MTDVDNHLDAIEDGVLSFLKPPGITSHDAVGIVRRILKLKRVGHSGTLDPLASGVLPIFIGKATRLIEYSDASKKTYVAEGCFGISTDTEDATGNVIEHLIHPIINPTWSDLEDVLTSFIGNIEQRPSSYSAIKVNGKRAYELARAGNMVELPCRSITIYSIKLIAYAYPYFTIRVECSSGTYIRALLRDIFLQFHIPGTMTQLTRTRVGMFCIADSITAEELEVGKRKLLLPSETAVNHLPMVRFGDSAILKFKQGKTVSTEEVVSTGTNDFIADNLYCSYGQNGFVGIVRYIKNQFKVEKNIFI